DSEVLSVNRRAFARLGAHLCILLAGNSTALAGGPDAHPIVPGFERLYAGEKADAVRGGQLLLRELSCLSCHTTGEPAVARKEPPVLDPMASRVRVSWLRKFLADPQTTKPGTTMPGLFVGDPERDPKVEALVQFLASTGRLKVGHSERKRI